MQGAMWKPYVMTKSQTLNRLTGLTSVFVNYRDAAGNESKVYAATIHVGPVVQYSTMSTYLCQALMKILFAIDVTRLWHAIQ
jgi:hypothetical protein